MIIVDFNQTAISTLMGELGGRTDVEIRKDLIRHMIVNAIRSYKVKFGAEFGEIVIACDNRHYWRKDKFPYYKASRKKSRADSGFDWKLIFDTLSEIRAELNAFFPYTVIDADGAEADDVIAILSQWTQTNDLRQDGMFGGQVPQPVLILSGDHDFIQLQKYKNVQQFSPIHKKWVKPDASIPSYLMEHIIKGDKGDGIPNILSPGDCFVRDLRQKPITKGTLDKLMQESYLEQDETTKANYMRNATLIDLTFIPIEIKEKIINTYEETAPAKRSKLLNYFIEHKLKNLMDVIEDF
jgi:5'-3' exonuclease